MTVIHDKKRQIIEAALKLFATKGFHETSIQDIAESVGIAKGSVYLHFKSKEDLLVSALKHTVHRMFEEVALASTSPGLSPRERLVRKLESQLRFGYEHKAFFTMLLNERSVHVNEELKKFMMDLRVRSVQWSLADILDVYGETIGPYAMDAVAALQALVGQYTGYLILHQVEIDIAALAPFLADRLEDVVDGMLKKGRPPMLTERMLLGPAAAPAAGEDERDARVDLRAHWIRILRETIRESTLDEAKREELHSYAVVLEHELRKPDPADAVVQGLLAHLRAAEPPAIGAVVRQVEQELARISR
ncbi:helix-turn-helix domain-containing protein [Paenibacillus sp.]|uniref:TetR/AcrR family transcriptional regulator n=1 Tax=Paenibacillus sp. TaxID=58172 RepID=UPI002812288C|nr:helix-turn-helix domain-containing protein [Paenibacillus sp.]